MTQSIGGVVLNPKSDMIWVDRFSSFTVEQTNRRTLGGRMVTYVAQLVAGRSITLQATDSYGWQRKEVVDQLLVLSEALGVTYTFVWGADSYSFIFDHSGGPAVDMQPQVARVAHATTDYFTGQIRMLTV